MKNKTWIPLLFSALFAFLLAVSSIGNLITGYQLPVGAMWKIFLWCAFAAAATTALFHIPHGGKIMIGLAALAVLGFCVTALLHPPVLHQIEHLFYCITSHYHDVYDWPVLGQQHPCDVSFPLIIWAALVSACVNWYICRRKHIAVAMVPAVAPLALCLLTADKIPGAVYLCLLILGLATLLITDWTRRKQPAHSTKMTLWFTLPVALFVVLLFLCNPQANYTNHASKMQKDLSVWFEKVQDAATSVMTGTPIDTSGDKRRNLQAVGERTNSTRSVMVVNSPIDGKLYLRERDFDVYTGAAWMASSEREERFTTGTDSVGTLIILTYSTRSTLLVPYYATGKITLTGGAVENDANLQQYTYSLSQTLSQETPSPSAQYKALPDETKEWATKKVNSIIKDLTTTEKKVKAIQEYVRNCATYDTATGRMDSSYSDFAQWFLEESDTGYCVHYATATAVLLRAAGITARYVEGYIVDGKAHTDVVVSKQKAHAWVEYYDWLTGAWYIVESTPIYPDAPKPKVIPNKSTGGGVLAGVGDFPEEIIPVETIPDEDPPEATEETTVTEPVTDPDATDGLPEFVGEVVPIAPNPKWKLPKWIKLLLQHLTRCLIFVFCVWLQGYARIYRKRKLWEGGTPNKRAICRWRQTRFLARVLKQPYPDELYDLALKARFSQHEIQPDELQKYEDYRLPLLALIAQKPWYQRLIAKWILAID